jgi:hypothetical protein
VAFEAVDASPFILARYWGERERWPARPEQLDELHELAVISRLGDWLWRWQPLHVHRAVLAGASGADVAAAAGCGPETVASRWRRWAQGQRRLYAPGEDSALGRRLGVSAVDVARVAAVLESGIEPGVLRRGSSCFGVGR